MRTCLLLLFFAIAVACLAAQDPYIRKCTEPELRQVEKEAVTLRTWDALHDSYRKYRHCEDVDAAEGYSESKARVLVDHWDTLPRAAQLIRTDKSFRNFVLVDATMDTADIKKIKQNATHNCPSGVDNLCKELIRTADEALEENATVQKH
jgi:hypothetical protein